MIERVVWIVTVLAVAGIAFSGGRQLGYTAGLEGRQQLAQQFFSERAGPEGAGVPGSLPGGQAAPGFAAGQGVSGEVQRIDGDTMVVTTSDGTTVTVKLSSEGVVRRQVDGQLSEIQPGEQVLVMGTREGDTVQASLIQVGTLVRAGR